MANVMDDDNFERTLMERLDESRGVAGEEEACNLLGAENDDAELFAMRDALRSYREQSLDWAQQRSAAMPSPLPARQSGWLVAPQWALGTAAFCACVVGAALFTHHQAVLVQQAAAVLPAAPTQQALSEDNELLSSVDLALRSSVSPTEQELGLSQVLDANRAQKRRAVQQHTD